MKRSISCILFSLVFSGMLTAQDVPFPGELDLSENGEGVDETGSIEEEISPEVSPDEAAESEIPFEDFVETEVAETIPLILEEDWYPIAIVEDPDGELYRLSQALVLDAGGGRKEFIWCRFDNRLFPLLLEELEKLEFTGRYDAVFPGYTEARLTFADGSLREEVLIATLGTLTGLDVEYGTRVGLYLNYNGVASVSWLREPEPNESLVEEEDTSE